MKSLAIALGVVALMILFGALLPYVQNEPVSYEAPTPEVTATSTVETPQDAISRLSEARMELEEERAELQARIDEIDHALGQYWTVRENREKLLRSMFPEEPETAVAVSECESTLRQHYEDGRVVRGIVDNRDVGIMQINLGYHGETAKGMGLDVVNNIVDNVTYGRHLYEQNGWRDWSASQHCWSKKVALR